MRTANWSPIPAFVSERIATTGERLRLPKIRCVVRGELVTAKFGSSSILGIVAMLAMAMLLNFLVGGPPKVGLRLVGGGDDELVSGHPQWAGLRLVRSAPERGSKELVEPPPPPPFLRGGDSMMSLSLDAPFLKWDLIWSALHPGRGAGSNDFHVVEPPFPLSLEVGCHADLLPMLVCFWQNGCCVLTTTCLCSQTTPWIWVCAGDPVLV